jgi:hypothetical protein
MSTPPASPLFIFSVHTRLYRSYSERRDRGNWPATQNPHSSNRIVPCAIEHLSPIILRITQGLAQISSADTYPFLKGCTSVDKSTTVIPKSRTFQMNGIALYHIFCFQDYASGRLSHLGVLSVLPPATTISQNSKPRICVYNRSPPRSRRLAKC